MKVAPSILENSAEDLRKSLSFLSPYYRRFQIDVADGIFVSNKTIQVADLLGLVPRYESTIFDFHLMVENPEIHIKEVERLPKKNIGIILIHKSVFPDYSSLSKRYPKVKNYYQGYYDI